MKIVKLIKTGVLLIVFIFIICDYSAPKFPLIPLQSFHPFRSKFPHFLEATLDKELSHR